MATKTRQSIARVAQRAAKTGAKTLPGLFRKCKNDWVMNFAAALAFNLITAMLPTLIALLAVAGLAVSKLSSSATAKLLDILNALFPASKEFVTVALHSLSKNAGPLVIIAVLVAIFGGSRLFVSMDRYFDVIYRTRPRKVIKQNLMAVVMLLIFIVLTIPVVFAALIPDVLLTFIPQSFFSDAIGLLVAVFISWVLLEAIYLVVPHRPIRFRKSWPGALVAAVLLQVYLSFFFPFYTTHFLGNYTGTIALAVVLLFFFYYFAVIVLLGAEINAFFAEDIKGTPESIPVIIHQYTSQVLASEQAMQEQAAPSHKGEEAKDMPPKGEAQASGSPASAPGQAQMKRTQRSGDRAASTGQQVKKRASRSAQVGAPGGLTVVEVLAGTFLAFIVQFLQLRRK